MKRHLFVVRNLYHGHTRSWWALLGVIAISATTVAVFLGVALLQPLMPPTFNHQMKDFVEMVYRY